MSYVIIPIINNMRIEWASHFNPDGTRRRPPPSTMHGWLAKMRGTLIGDEELRSRGMREMREAASARKYKQYSAQTGKSMFSFLGFGSSGQKQQPRKLQQRGTQSRRPTYESTNSRSSRRPPRRSSGTSHRSSQRPPSSRQQSYSTQTGQRRSSRR
ncbi:hypothetical protein BDZ97DRAFT_246303 [Flammula alnicola]|nr:hypothetical protein BDZ97DRAFT_246303 [Flammula alnicola]